jgi:hypothetical protein
VTNEEGYGRDKLSGDCLTAPPLSPFGPSLFHVSAVPASIGYRRGGQVTEAPDFEALRARRDAALEVIAGEMWEQLGGDPKERPTFHCREFRSPCYCACPQGPCEHEFTDWREFEDGLGGEAFCPRCGEGAMHHSMKCEGDW